MGREAEGVAGPRRVGIFGGTFDPPHHGHASAARDVAGALDLDEVLWVPVGEPPHKPDAGLTPAPLRLAMVEAMAALDPCFRVADLEMKRSGPSYTVDTLRELRAEAGRGDADFFLIMGIDQYRVLDSWRAPEELPVLAQLAVMDRGGESVLSPPDRVMSVQVRRIDISSTDVRARVRDGRDISDLVPPAVARIIEAEGLYRA